MYRSKQKLCLYVALGDKKIYINEVASRKFPNGCRFFLGLNREMLSIMIGTYFTIRVNGVEHRYTVNDVYADYENSGIIGCICGGLVGTVLGPIGTLIGCIAGYFIAKEWDSEINIPAKEFNESVFEEKKLSSP